MKTTYKKFLKYLKNTYPLAIPDYKVSLSFVEGNMLAPKLHAHVSYDFTGATITLPSKANPMVILKNLGHEYRHLIQVINMNWTRSEGTFKERERDADEFGNEVAWEWVKLEGKI